MTKSDKKTTKKSAGKKSKARLVGVTRPKDSNPGPLVSDRTLSQLYADRPESMTTIANSNSLSRALGGIQMAVMTVDETQPKKLAKIGRRLRAISPKGYEEDWLPPLSAIQIKSLLCDKDCVAYIRSAHPGRLGPTTIRSLLIIADLLLEHDE